MKYDTSYSTVPLFKATKNKELVGKSSRTGGTIVLSRKSLFELQSSWSEKENIHDELANMMCLPVTENESNACTVKVS